MNRCQWCMYYDEEIGDYGRVYSTDCRNKGIDADLYFGTEIDCSGFCVHPNAEGDKTWYLAELKNCLYALEYARLWWFDVYFQVERLLDSVEEITSEHDEHGRWISWALSEIQQIRVIMPGLNAVLTGMEKKR